MRLSFAWIACVFVPAVVSAQAPLTPSVIEEGPAIEGAPAVEAPIESPPTLVIHVDTELRAYGAALVRTLARRVDLDVELGSPPPGSNAAALPVGHVGIVPTEAHDGSLATVTLIGEAGRIFETEVGLPRQRTAALRALALAVIDLRDASLEAPPPAEEPVVIAPGEIAPARAGRSTYVYLEPEGGLFGRRRSIESLARPTIYFRALLGYSTAQQSFLVGPGIGVGLCLGDNCVVIEGDLPVLEERRLSADAEQTPISYRAVNLALRLQLRPIRIDSVTIGVTFGLLSRVGGAWQPDGTTAVVSGFGTRQSLEIAWTIERPFEWVIEGGADVAINPARYIQSTDIITNLEDSVTVWGLTALRVRP